MKKFWIALIIFLAPSITLAKYNDLTIIVSSCDKYSPLWEPFFGSLWRHWPSLNAENKDTPILLISNKQTFHNPRVKTINIPNEASWTDNMLVTLAQVKSKYVLVMLDDYWLNKDVDERRLAELFATMQHEDAAMLQLSYNDLRYQSGAAHPKVAGLQYRNKYAHYKVSLQSAIWDKQALLDLLRPGENPWDFELAGTARSHGYPRTFLTVSDNEPIAYLNATYQGHIRQEAIVHAAKYNLPYDAKAFPQLGNFNPRLSAKIWRARLQKFWAFVQHPGLFYSYAHVKNDFLKPS